MHFETQEEANAWVEDSLKPCESSGSAGCEVLVSRDGLVFEFAKVPNRRQINVSLFQVFVKGEKAQQLPAAGDALTVEK